MNHTFRQYALSKLGNPVSIILEFLKLLNKLESENEIDWTEEGGKDNWLCMTIDKIVKEHLISEESSVSRTKK